jgi:hypothetical protein
LNYQIDLPYYLVRLFSALGGVVEYKDYKNHFIENYYKPFMETHKYKNDISQKAE